MRTMTKLDRAHGTDVAKRLRDEPNGRPRELQNGDDENPLVSNDNEHENRSNDDDCDEPPPEVYRASVDVEFDYDLIVPADMKSKDVAAQVRELHNKIPTRLKEELGICESVRLLSQGERGLRKVGIYDVEPGDVDRIRTDVECKSAYLEACYPVKASVTAKYDTFRQPFAKNAAATTKLYLRDLMDAEYIATDEGYRPAFVEDRPARVASPQASAGSVATVRGTNDDSSLAIGLICAAAAVVALVLLAAFAQRRRRRSQIEHEGLALEGAPEKQADADDDATLDLDIERTGTFEADASRGTELPVLREDVIHEDEDEI